MIASIVSDIVRTKRIFQEYHISERNRWEGLADDLRSRLIKEGEGVLSFAWPFLTLSMLQEFFQERGPRTLSKTIF